MPEAIIKKLADKGFGFIQSLNNTGDYFFHISYVAKGHDFASLKEGDTVEFKLRPSKNKPGQQEAFDVRPKQGASVVQQQAAPSTTPGSGRLSESTVLPYGFVPIAPERAIADTPIWHDGSSGGELFSGEILCELEALTPLLPGNARYTVEKADRQRLQQWGFGELKNEKQIAEPLRLPDGRVVIAGSALKGMIRHSLGALTSAPMERVGERHFTYRPNLDLRSQGSQRYVVRPALILAERNGGWDIDVFDDARAALFVRQDAANTIRKTAVDGVVSGMISGVEERQNRILGSRTGRHHFQHRLANYKGGIDGQGLIATAFNDDKRGPFTYDLALVPQQAKYTLHLDANLYQRYVQDQKTVLADQKIGHLTAHPLGNKNSFNGEKIKDSIRDHAEFSVGQLIYVELATDANGRVSPHSKIVSCGHHFRYRWAYSSSIRQQKGQARDCLTPIADEQANKQPERLTGARLLFGYVRDDETNPIGQGEFERLAGRIAINHAVSIGLPRFLGDPGKGHCIPLKILGQPKPSAWEFYLQQPDDPKKPLNTYGDLPGEVGGKLAGRKFYRHQPGTMESGIEAVLDEEDQSDSKIHPVNNDQATLARFICQPGTRFRFSIRFARLRDWELGALLTVLEPWRLTPEGKADDYAHKLGLGRPLGMGSVRIARQAIRLRRERDAEFPAPSQTTDLVARALQASSAEFDQTLVQEWLAAHRWQDGQKLGYPQHESKGTIYDWHTDIRKDYSRLRRQKDPDWSQLAGKIQRRLFHT